MNDKRTYYLLSKYISNSITTKEFEELKRCINISDDEKLYEELSLLWKSYSSSEKLFTKELDQIFYSIEKQTHIDLLHRSTMRLMRIAATLLLPLLCSVATYLYMDNQEQTFINNQMTILAENGHRAAVILPDGTNVKLNSGSHLSYPQKFGKKTREVNLSGEAFFNVTKDPEKKFIVHTKHINIEVLGTTFNVYSYESENTVEMVLLSGHVKIKTNQSPSQIIYAKPHEKVSYDKQSGLVNIKKTEARFETAWLRDELVFRSEKLENVFYKLERKYGVTIRKEKFAQGNDLFTGSFGNEDLTHILNILKTHYNFKYKVFGNEIKIYGEK